MGAWVNGYMSMQLKYNLYCVLSVSFSLILHKTRTISGSPVNSNLIVLPVGMALRIHFSEVRGECFVHFLCSV